MFNVTSDTAASVSLQAAPPKSARPDPSQLNDSFGAMVDSSLPPNTAAASPQRRDDMTTSQDNSRPRDTSADQASQNASDDRNTSVQKASDASVAANADANTAPAPRSKTKSDSSKDSSAKTTDKPSSDKASATDQATSAQQAAPSATTPNPVAVAIQVTVASTDVAVAPAATGTPTAPLAIAAAAIAAASAPAAAAKAASSAQTKADSSAAASAAGSAADGASTAAEAAAATSAKTGVQTTAATTTATTAKQPATAADATTVADTGLSAAITVAAPVTPKATLAKTAGTVSAKGMASVAPDSKSAKSDPATTDAMGPTLPTNATQAAANAKPQAGVDPAKAEPNAASVSAASAHDHTAVNATAAQTSTDALDAGSQVAGPIQPQLPAAVTTAAPAAALNVTSATSAPVPLSGLAVEIAASAIAGKSHFEIRLDPAELGRIDVRIDVDHNGQVTSHLTVERPETLSMLRQDAPQLQRALDDAGFKTGDGGLQFSLRDQSSSGQNNGNDNGRNAQRLVISEDDTIPATVAGRTYGRMLASSSGVDIRV